MKLEPPDIDNINYVEKIWHLYQQDPLAVSSEWRTYFNDLVQSRLSTEKIPPGLQLGKQQLH